MKTNYKIAQNFRRALATVLLLLYTGYTILIKEFHLINILFTLLALIILYIDKILKLFSVKKNITVNSQQEKELKLFKKNAKKIIVDLDSIEIKSNDWTDTIIVENNLKAAGLNQLFGNPDANTKQVNREIHFLKIRIPYAGKVINCDTQTSMDLDNLKIKLALKKSTILYVSPYDLSEYYLDLEFLTKKH